MVEADAAAVYDAGWDEQALFDAVSVCALFKLMNRIVEGSGHQGVSGAGKRLLTCLERIIGPSIGRCPT